MSRHVLTTVNHSIGTLTPGQQYLRLPFLYQTRTLHQVLRLQHQEHGDIVANSLHTKEAVYEPLGRPLLDQQSQLSDTGQTEYQPVRSVPLDQPRRRAETPVVKKYVPWRERRRRPKRNPLEIQDIFPYDTTETTQHVGRRPAFRRALDSPAISYYYDPSTEAAEADGSPIRPKRLSSLTTSEAESFQRLLSSMNMPSLSSSQIPSVFTESSPASETTQTSSVESLDAIFSEIAALPRWEIDAEAQQAEATPSKKKKDENDITKLRRIERSMGFTENVAALWTILEEEVFTLIAPLLSALNAKKRGRPKKGETPAESSLTLPKKALATASRVYPPLLTLALRLFLQRFQSPQPALLLYQRVKSMGPISYALGASTDLYNLLLYLQWHFYKDFRAISALREEMEDAGVEPDSRTVRLLAEMVRRGDVMARGMERRGKLILDMLGWKEGLLGLKAWLEEMRELERLKAKEPRALERNVKVRERRRRAAARAARKERVYDPMLR
ncbi:MAG: hypothetical protein M1824_004544 [Vezdaea acicularis]|nr:MAG: hypothetical protein M1824_004544 [Vezdaea acicularis]